MGTGKPIDPIGETISKITKHCYIFKNSMDEVWVSYYRDNKKTVIPIKSDQFESIVRKFYFYIDNSPASQAVTKKIVNYIQALGEFGTNVDRVFIRNGYDEANNHYIDLGNQVIRLEAKGFNLTKHKTAPHFFQPKSFECLPIPSKEPSLNELKKYINVKTESDFRLIVGWVLSALNSKNTTPILILQGEQGSSKSTLAKVLRRLIDPNKIPLRQCPKNEQDLFISAKNSPIIIWDNLSGIPDWASDSLCRLCTGGGFATRKLYTDTDETIINAQRPIILNGIDTIATRGDLMDRSIVFDLPRIDKNKRLTESSFWDSFEKDLPKILSSLYAAFCYGLNTNESLNFNSLPRMADFAVWSTACCNYFEWEENVILKDYKKNRVQAIETSIASDNFAQAILMLLEKNPNWESTSNELINKLKDISGGQTGIPSLRTLKDNLKRLSPTLNQLGYDWEDSRKSKGSVYKFSPTKLQK